MWIREYVTWIVAAISAPNPFVIGASWAMITRPVFFTDCNIQTYNTSYHAYTVIYYWSLAAAGLIRMWFTSRPTLRYNNNFTCTADAMR